MLSKSEERIYKEALKIHYTPLFSNLARKNPDEIKETINKFARFKVYLHDYGQSTTFLYLDEKGEIIYCNGTILQPGLFICLDRLVSGFSLFVWRNDALNFIPVPFLVFDHFNNL
jgi:hypothetical protein